jgi:hypothetical protein
MQNQCHTIYIIRGIYINIIEFMCSCETQNDEKLKQIVSTAVFNTSELCFI